MARFQLLSFKENNDNEPLSIMAVFLLVVYWDSSKDNNKANKPECCKFKKNNNMWLSRFYLLAPNYFQVLKVKITQEYLLNLSLF